MKCLFIYNPNSGRGKVLKYLNYITSKLQEAFISVEVFESTSANNFKTKIEEKGSLVDVLVFSGGDGTFNDCLSGVSKLINRPILGYIPTGTANDVARNLKIPRNIKKATNIILKKITIDYDVGLINNLYFAYVVGIGAGTEISYTTNQHAKKILGRLAYFREGLTHFFDNKLLDVKVKCDNVVIEEKTPLLLVLNSLSVGGLPFNRYKKLNDGTFDLIIIKNGKAYGRFNILKYFIRGILGFRKKKFATYLNGSEFEITVGDDVIWCCDGEKGPSGSCVIKNLHNHVKIYVNPKRIKKRG